MKTKVLVLSGSLGDGHQQAANAIRETCKLYKPDVEVETIDFMEWTHPHLHSLGRYLYIQGVKTFPSVYGYLYQKTRKPGSLTVLLKKLKRFGLGRMMKLLQETQPSIVVSTFPGAAAAMSILKANGLVRVPTVTVITDHSYHSYWVHPYTDHYIVGSNTVRNGLNELGILDKQISVTGIPIRPHFYETYDRDRLLAKYALDSQLKTVLVMGGGCGIIGNGLKELLQSEALTERRQFIIVCGRNEKLRMKLSGELKNSKHHILLLGYMNRIHELMAVSDLIITKPGGLTSSEAMAFELPMLMYKPMPGQERDNAAFLLQSGVAVEAKNEQILALMLSQLLRHPQMLMSMKQKAKKLRKELTALHALETILHTLESEAPAYGSPHQGANAAALMTAK